MAKIRPMAAMMLVMALGRTALGADDAALTKAWDDLASTDAATSAAARQTLEDGGGKAMALIVARLTAKPDAAMVQEALKKLDAAEFKTRQSATESIIAMGKAVESMLPADSARLSTESATRIATIRNVLKTQRVPAGADQRRQDLAVSVLETFGTKGLGSLESVARDCPWDGTRSAAKSASARIAQAEIDRLFSIADITARRGGPVEEYVKSAAEMAVAAEMPAEDEVLAYRRKRVEAIAAAAARAKELRGQLSGEKAAEARAELVHLALVALDSPEAAAADVEASTTGKAAELTRLIKNAGDPRSAKPADLVAIADAYRELARDAGVAGAVDMLRRSKAAVDAALAREGIAPELAVTLKARSAGLESDIVDAGMEQGAGMNLLAAFDLNRNVIAGEWKRDGGGLAVKSGEFSRVDIPVTPAGNYELKVSLVRAAGEQGIYIAIPVGRRRANLNVGGWGNTVTGLEQVAGVDAEQQEDAKVSRKSGIDAGKVYDYVIRVESKGLKAKITVSENGRPLVDWEGNSNLLSSHGVWVLSRPTNLGLGAHKCDVVFKSARLKMLTGKADVDRALKAIKPPPVRVPVEVDDGFIQPFEDQ